MNPIPIKLPRLHAGNEDMPIVVSTVNGGIQRDHTSGPPVVFVVKNNNSIS